MTTMGDGWVIRNPKRGKAHRIASNSPNMDGRPFTGCSMWADRMTDEVPLMQVAAEDLCGRCFVEVE